MSRDQRRRLLRRLRDTGFTVDGGSVSTPLGFGPPARRYHGDWPEFEAQMLAEWNRHRETALAQNAPGPRPWSYFWFDVPHGETIPGAQRDANLAAGRLTPAEAEMMAWSHAQHAFGRIAAGRPGETTADWLNDPGLIEKSIALVGWNPFTESVIAHLRQTYSRPGAVRRSPVHPPTEQETADDR